MQSGRSRLILVCVTEPDPEFKTYSLEEVAAMIDIDMEDPVRWLQRRIRSGRAPARKVGRSWRMTIGDIRELLDGCKNQRPAAVDEEPRVRGLSKQSLARRVGSKQSLARRISD